MHNFYFANQFKHRHESRQVQMLLQHYHDLHLLNPFYDNGRDDVKQYDLLEKKADLNTMVKTRCERMTDDRCLEIMLTDLEWISECDGIVCILYDHDVLGSFMEIFYCSYILKLPVYLICAEPSIRDHLWIRALCWKIFSNIDEFIEYVRFNPKEMR